MVVVVEVAVGVAVTRVIGAAMVGTGADAPGGTGADAAGAATGDSLGVGMVGADLPPPSTAPWQHNEAGLCGMCGVKCVKIQV